MHSLRAVIDARGQRVSATDRLYLLEAVPTLIAWGEKDRTIPIEHGRAAHAAVPHSRFVTFPGAAHFPHLEAPGELAAAIGESIGALQARGDLEHVNIEVCTLDRCQGREAEYVFISLVRGRSTPFLDVPKRWNVALTRAMQGLFIFGDIDAYRDEADAARRDMHARTRDGRPLMSLLARVVEAYDRQIASRRPEVSR